VDILLQYSDGARVIVEYSALLLLKKVSQAKIAQACEIHSELIHGPDFNLVES
jgi:hypothetical protein